MSGSSESRAVLLVGDEYSSVVVTRCSEAMASTFYVVDLSRSVIVDDKISKSLLQQSVERTDSAPINLNFKKERYFQ